MITVITASHLVLGLYMKHHKIIDLSECERIHVYACLILMST